MTAFNERLYELRKQRGLTQNDLADYVGVNKQTISQYERGVRRPDYETLERLCDYFNVSTDYMLGKVDITPRYVDSDGLARLDGYASDGYYIDPATAEAAQAAFDDPDLRALFDIARDSTPDDIKMATDLLRRLKATNPDG